MIIAPPISPALRRLWMAFGLLLVPLFMATIGFFVFPPLYTLWCTMTGTGLSPNSATAKKGEVEGAGEIEVIFNQRANELPVRFYAERRIMRVKPGVSGDTVFHFTNLSDQPLTFRPVHSVTPIQAQTALELEICFCFKTQTVGPHETKDFPVRFYFSNDIDPRVGSATITYTLFAQDSKP